MSTNVTSVLSQLEQERSLLKSQLEQLSNALSALNGGARTSLGRTMSAAGRARIAAAQRARWAKVKGSQARKAAPVPAKRKMSAAAIARIRTAQKALSAKWRKSHRGA